MQYPPSTHPQQKEPSSAVTPPPTIDEDKDFPPDYMCLSVMLTVMALICTATLGWVFTIPAVVFSIMVSSLVTMKYSSTCHSPNHTHMHFTPAVNDVSRRRRP
jgi:hypothetical protein